MPGEGEHDEIKRLLEENSKLIKENNELLRKLHRNSVIGIILRVIWYVLLIGIPFALYVYLLEPYFEALGSNLDLFKAGLNELPGLKGISQIIDTAFGQ